MKTTYHQMEQLMMNEGTKKVIDKATGEFGLRLARAISKMNAEMPVLGERIKKVQEKYAQKDEKGEYVTKPGPNSSRFIDFGKNESMAAQEIMELKNAEVDLSIEPIEYDPERNGKDGITGSEFLAILPLLKE